MSDLQPLAGRAEKGRPDLQLQMADVKNTGVLPSSI
jgi:hypothetical protein